MRQFSAQGHVFVCVCVGMCVWNRIYLQRGGSDPCCQLLFILQSHPHSTTLLHPASSHGCFRCFHCLLASSSSQQGGLALFHRRAPSLSTWLTRLIKDSVTFRIQNMDPDRLASIARYETDEGRVIRGQAATWLCTVSFHHRDGSWAGCHCLWRSTMVSKNAPLRQHPPA